MGLRLAIDLVLALFSVDLWPAAPAPILHFQLWYWLGRMKIQGRKGVLSDQDRHQIADYVVASLMRHGDPWDLNEQVTNNIAPAAVSVWLAED